MRILLHPAIRLMNRLSFGMKFSLISALFFVPMLVTNFYLVRDSYQVFVHTQIEAQGLQLLDASLNTTAQLEHWHDLLRINAVIGQGGTTGELEQRIERLQKDIANQWQHLELVQGSAEQRADFDSKRNQLLAQLEAVHQQPSLQTRAVMAGELLASGVLFNRFITSQTGLSQDTDLEVRQLVALITEVTPDVTQSLGEGRAVASLSMARGYLDSTNSNLLDNLQLGLDKLSAEYEMKLNEALSGSIAASQALSSYAAESRVTLQDALRLLEDDVIMADSLDKPWGDLYQQTSTLIDKTHNLNSQVIDYLAGVLGERLVSYRWQMSLLIAALAAVFLLIGYLYSAFYVSTRSSLRSLGLVMDQVAAGDLTAHFKVQSRDELGELGGAFNQTVQRIHALLEQVNNTVHDVEGQATRVLSVSAQSNTAAAEQRAQIEQVATAMNEMSATSQEVANSAASAVGNAQSVNDETISGRVQVEQQVSNIQKLAQEIDGSVVAINQLATNSKSIGQVLDVIKGIAEQTNLLALNAAIEAARAGEQGRGFAVVADEVRNLAQRTQHSTAEIEQMISQLHGGVSSAVKAMSASHVMADETVAQSVEVQSALENILAAVGMIVDQIQQIAAAAEQQTAVAHDIDQNIVQINQTGELTAQGADETAQASQDMSAQVEHLKTLISAFKM
ncbi:methyl-accepting chemotaxis protein [Denitrificimonas caeni]|uniref:Methyl-accepting chemotaxis protein n=1 Tax=Denitrificimonas caeni TaxID=521720 RepID=A0AAE9VR53_9GAMM|nr:methyl-accepting chemotaxis protein [Denitrificimonas caeni]WBE25967.1 methyl-accepting chemotaxis protein [Denitrificimonas caeni]